MSIDKEHDKFEEVYSDIVNRHSKGDSLDISEQIAIRDNTISISDLVLIPVNLITDSGISMKSRMLILILASFKANWLTIKEKELMQLIDSDEKEFYSILVELVDGGYLKIETIKEEGKICGERKIFSLVAL